LVKKKSSTQARKVKNVKKASPPKPESQEQKRGVRITEIPGEVRIERSPFKLKGKIKYLSTDIDSLHAFVLEKKKVTLTQAAAKYQVTRSTAEDWGKILEDHRMIELHYPVAGEPILRVIQPKGQRRKKKKDKEEEKKSKEEIPKYEESVIPSGKSPEGKPQEFKPKGPGLGRFKKFTKKRIFIMAEIILLGELFIYIFFVNPHLRNNFIPTLNYQITNLIPNMVNLPNYISGRDLLINPIYFILGIIIVSFWIAVAIVQKRKKPSYSREWKKRHEHAETPKKTKE
jgi:hypothetical protein